jgi:hypothetical protein
MKQTMKQIGGTAGVAALALAATATMARAADNPSWLDNTISPVGNPIYFEDPNITSEVRPIYMYHALPDQIDIAGGAHAPLGGKVQVEAVQLRYALNDRLAIIATKDGYISFQPNETLPHDYGFADLAAGLKYKLIDNQASQFVLTPGFTLTLPTGGHQVFQGRGSAEWNLFASAEKGFNNLHVTANAGLRLPDNLALQTAQIHYSAQVDYYTCQYFIPFVVANGYTVLNNGHRNSVDGVPLNTELYDLINSGSTAASGQTEFTVGTGFRTRLAKNLDLGFAYEAGTVEPVGIFDHRFTTDLIWRF